MLGPESIKTVKEAQAAIPSPPLFGSKRKISGALVSQTWNRREIGENS
jgi:hypothetical protein